jgi:hypothetical protein
MKPRLRQNFRMVWIALFAATLLFAAVPAAAATLDEYSAKVERARALIEEIETSLRNDDRDHSYRLSRVEDIRSDFSRPERVDWYGGTVEVPNAWLLDRLKSFEKETDPEQSLAMIVEICEYVTALSFKLNELKESTTTVSRTKDEDKQKLAEILRREEYQKPQPKGESLFQRWLAAIMEFLEKLLPKPKGPSAGPSGMGALGAFLQILLWIALFGLLAFLIYKIAPLLFPGLRRTRKPRKKNRVILGERIAEDETALDLLSEAERLAREGNLRGAIRKGYIALLCDLSDRKIIGLAGNKTNRDYIRDVRSRRDLHSRMKSVTDTFERHWYGAQKSEEHDWVRFREEYEAAVRSV